MCLSVVYWTVAHGPEDLSFTRCLWFEKMGLNLNFDWNKRQQSRMEGGKAPDLSRWMRCGIFNFEFLTLWGLSSRDEAEFRCDGLLFWEM